MLPLQERCHMFHLERLRDTVRSYPFESGLFPLIFGHPLRFAFMLPNTLVRFVTKKVIHIVDARTCLWVGGQHNQFLGRF